MSGVVIRLVLAVLALGGGVRLLTQAKRLRAAWSVREAGVTRAEQWWARTHGGPFDQEREAVPDDVALYLGPQGPRSDLRRPRPAQAQWVWGWLLIVIATLLLVTVAAQVSSGTA